jgi:hypothetical protein
VTAAEARRASEQDGRFSSRSAMYERTDAVVASLMAEGTDETLARRVALCVIGKRNAGSPRSNLCWEPATCPQLRA